MPRTIVLLPTYNERNNLGPMLDAVRAQLPDAHVLVIDDDSPDGTGAVAEDRAARDALIEVAHRPAKRGLGVAYRYGYRRALDEGFDFVLQMDCDFSHDPRDLPRLRALLETHPAVVGSRRVAGGGTEGWPWYRNLVSNAGSLYARLVLDTSVRDLTTGYKGFRREALLALDACDLRTDGFGFQIEVTAQLLARGIPVHEMPITFVDRRWGQSKMTARIFVEAMAKVWSLRSVSRCPPGSHPNAHGDEEKGSEIERPHGQRRRAAPDGRRHDAHDEPGHAGLRRPELAQGR